MSDPLQLSKRERQIMEVIYARREASVNQLLGELPGPVSGQAVRTFLRILEAKGHLVHRKVGKENLYKPTRARGQVAKGALRRLLDTFFGGEIEKALATHLSDPRTKLRPEQLQRIQDLINRARGKGA